MAIDSEEKRKSAATVGQYYMPVSPVPSGSIANPKRQQVGWSYSGIEASAPVVSDNVQSTNNIPLCVM